MTFQADDTPIYVSVSDKKTGEKINADDFVAAKYEISTLAGVVLFTAHYPGEITIQNEQFKILFDRQSNNITGSLLHEMRVKDASGKETTIMKTIINNEQTSVRL